MKKHSTTPSLKGIARHAIVLAAIVLAGQVMAACLRDDEEVDYTQYNDLYVSHAALGLLPRYLHTTAKDGSDSIYKTTVSAASAYPLTIDHLANRIYNADSLPQGVDAEKIIFSTFNVSQGMLALEMIGRTDEATGEPVDTAYSTTDSIDFAQGPRRFKLYGLDGTSRRTYTVDIRIHREAVDSLTWRHLSAADWQPAAMDRGAHGNAYTLDDSIAFTLSAGTMLCAVGDAAPQPDAMEEENAGELPDANLTWQESPNRADALTKQVILYGTVQRDTLESRVWRRNVDTTGKTPHRWEYLPATFENRYPAPPLHHATLLRYDGGLLLTGIDSQGLVRIKYSDDGGRIWRNHAILQLPEELRQRRAATLEAGIDAYHNLWLLIDGTDTWYGRAHSVAWEEEQKIFLRSPRRTR